MKHHMSFSRVARDTLCSCCAQPMSDGVKIHSGATRGVYILCDNCVDAIEEAAAKEERHAIADDLLVLCDELIAASQAKYENDAPMAAAASHEETWAVRRCVSRIVMRESAAALHAREQGREE